MYYFVEEMYFFVEMVEMLEFSLKEMDNARAGIYVEGE
jgi:hypothetical protein